MSDPLLSGFTPSEVRPSDRLNSLILIHPHQTLARTSAKRTRTLFTSEYGDSQTLPSGDASHKAHLSTLLRAEYDSVRELPPALAAKVHSAAALAAARRKKQKQPGLATADDGVDASTVKLLEGIPSSTASTNQSLVLRPNGPGGSQQRPAGTPQSSSAITSAANAQIKPTWHAPWKLMRVISGHLGWVRALAVEPNNQWFATGAGDRTIKIWDLASGNLRLTLTGHISTVRGLAVSPRHPYMFSCGEDKMVKCWDLESNRVIRHYHGHLSGVYALALHPTLDVLITTGRDAVARVWDMRTRDNVMVLGGHTGTVSSLLTQEGDPQVITGSMDSTIRLWDLAAGKSMGVLTHHKKSVRALASHPKEFTFASGSADNIKQWKCPEGAFMQNLEGAGGIINTLSVNEDDVCFSGADNGEMCFFDWKSGYRYQRIDTTAQPGSLEAEQGVFVSTFDKTGLRLITGEADKTIKIWKQDENATEETHPLDWKPSLQRRKY